MPVGFDTSAASSAPASTPAADAPRVSPRSSQRTAVAARRARASRRHPDPWRDADAQGNVDEMARSLEARGRTPAQARLRRRFLKFVPVGAGERVVEVGCDFGVVAVTHPDRALTEGIMRGVAERVYEEPHSGRRLPGLLRAAGLVDVRLLTDVYQDTTLEPWTKTFLERRAERAVRFGIVDVSTAERWLDGFTEVVAADAFVLTLNYYGAVGTKPA